VFEKDYELPSLEEIKSYIDQHKHLPEVPSAKEMEQNGINLSEMNMILLRKIEELTLHVIQQDRLINQLQADRSVSADSVQTSIEEIRDLLLDQQRQINEIKQTGKK
jgi:DNA-binding winged helix-turn-helix (wHTH) protein